MEFSKILGYKLILTQSKPNVTSHFLKEKFSDVGNHSKFASAKQKRHISHKLAIMYDKKNHNLSNKTKQKISKKK